MKAVSEVFGTLSSGSEVRLYTITNSNGLSLKVTNFGGIIQSLRVPDKNGKIEDVVLGFDKLEGYLGDHPYFGTLVGRYANRIGGARFVLDGIEYQLARNNGPNHLHGGIIGFDKVLLESSSFADNGRAGVMLEYLSHDMEEGYPGNLRIKHVISINQENEIELDYQATTDKSTPVNLTNHSYFNLSSCKEKIYDHELEINSSSYLEVDQDSIPTGKILDLTGSPLDFRKPKKIGKDLEKIQGGYDHCYVLPPAAEEPVFAARLSHPQSGRSMEVFTTNPGVQLYSSNYLDGKRGKAGLSYTKHMALCLETQHFPDSPNQPGFPGTILHPGETYSHRTIYKFIV